MALSAVGNKKAVGHAVLLHQENASSGLKRPL
jgi:hypothetical protein